MSQKKNRNEQAVEDMKKKVQEQREIAFGKQIQFANKRNDYIRNALNGRYYLARCNMMAEQIIAEDIKEKIDECPKTLELLRAEYALMKMQAIMSMRNAHFSKEDLKKDFSMTDEDIEELEEDYYNGKIIREDYDGSYKKGTKAEFVNSSEY